MATHRILLYDEDIGELRPSRTGVEFQYSESALSSDIHALSIRLPKRAEVYSDVEARAFFENLLPESEFRSLLAASVRVSEGNTAGLLGVIGGECAGAVSIWPENASRAIPPEYEGLTAEHIQSFFAQENDEALIEAAKKGRLSIAGAQEKLALKRDADKWLLPLRGSPSTHILKRSRHPKPGLIENELFAMRLGRAAGLECANAEIVEFAGMRVFVTERFDRVVTPDGITRLHQEDFCQALGILPNFKYQAEGGPAFSACVNLIESYSAAPISDLPALVRWMIFNYLVGNADAHAKNIAFLYTNEGLRLAPFYDLVATRVYRDLSPKSAMKFGGQYDLTWLDLDDWSGFAAQTRLPPAVVARILDDTISRLRAALPDEVSRAITDCGEDPVFETIAEGIRHRSSIAEKHIKELAVTKRASAATSSSKVSR